MSISIHPVAHPVVSGRARRPATPESMLVDSKNKNRETTSINMPFFNLSAPRSPPTLIVYNSTLYSVWLHPKINPTRRPSH